MHVGYIHEALHPCTSPMMISLFWDVVAVVAASLSGNNAGFNDTIRSGSLALSSWPVWSWVFDNKEIFSSMFCVCSIVASCSGDEYPFDCWSMVVSRCHIQHVTRKSMQMKQNIGDLNLNPNSWIFLSILGSWSESVDILWWWFVERISISGAVGECALNDIK